MRGALLGGPAAALEALVEPDGLAPAARLAVYRHHVESSLTAVLRAAHPAVVRLVDERFFAYAAREFIRAEPPAGPCLAEYGAGLAAFLERFPPCRALPWLADVARLEWLRHEAALAPGAPPLGRETLAAISPARWPGLGLRLDPSIRHLASPWPVDRIWLVNQPGASGELDLAAETPPGGVRLEIRRQDGLVTMRRLQPGPFRLRRALAGGLVVEEAAAAALEEDPSLRLTEALAEILADGLIVGLATSTDD